MIITLIRACSADGHSVAAMVAGTVTQRGRVEPLTIAADGASTLGAFAVDLCAPGAAADAARLPAAPGVDLWFNVTTWLLSPSDQGSGALTLSLGLAMGDGGESGHVSGGDGGRLVASVSLWPACPSTAHHAPWPGSHHTLPPPSVPQHQLQSVDGGDGEVGGRAAASHPQRRRLQTTSSASPSESPSVSPSPCECVSKQQCLLFVFRPPSVA